ncbi:hybrid sensor histidine kinase/response regulator [Fimbriiglobus ruber]|uniref:histidine kinase n=1 Tax=Fimbriiglobus ruber TaxID=1908690 RepID=A0A225E525_9BACT|nr:hybrid sensor histidine kinase/response regulator [Fimbriiglobus ruber]OWK43517.1 Chemotaxis protein methyltransferase CheR [Fimbriiglobus ruber]
MATPAPKAAIRVLLVDDDQDDYILTRDLVAEIPGNSYVLDWVSDYDAGLEAVGRGEHDVYLFDYRLGTRTGLDLLAAARGRGLGGPFILLTGQGQSEIDRAAAAAGAADYLEKGKLDAVSLERSIRYACQQKLYETELERKVQERTSELAAANASLRDADRRKDEFLATLAHELRNPLAPIRNALEIMRLAAGNLSGIEQSRQIIDRQVRQMVRLIDDLLDVSRITRGKVQLNLEPVPVPSILDAALETSRPQLEKAGLKIVSPQPAKTVWVKGDRVRLAQVFSNLLNNAAKYTEPGGTVTVEHFQEGDWAVIVVRDTGVGIPPDALPHVFDLFTQVDRTLNRAGGGLGIGLAIVRRLVEMHQGQVSVTSPGVGHGTEFTVRMPAIEPPR